MELRKRYFALFTGVAEATFDGHSSVIQYSNTLYNASREPSMTLSFRLRTRDSNATILHLRDTVLDWFISVKLFDGKLKIPPDSGVFVADGRWHEITVTYTDNMTLLIVDGNNTDFVLVDVGNRFRGIIDSNCEVFVGADAASSSHFKGCLDEVRINSLLLPFFLRAELANDTSIDRFDVARMTNVEVGCWSDDVCNSTAVCLNNGTCRDVWNAHVCDCAAGFNGTSCELEIDECAVGHDCENGATCIDGIASYSCICAPGYTGPRYEPHIFQGFHASWKVLESPGFFFLKIPGPGKFWKIVGLGKSWKLKLKVLESRGEYP